MPPSGHKILPVTLVAGCLGAGKTTLLQRLLSTLDCRRVTVLENELGEVAVDDELLRPSRPGRLDLVVGRTCREARGELVRQLYAVAAVADAFDRLLIEAVGVAHPGLIAQVLFVDSALRARLRLDGIVTVVDATHFAEQAGRDRHAIEQVAWADAIVVNKTDLVPVEAIEPLMSDLRRINPVARCFVTVDARAPADVLLNLGGFDLSRVENGMPGAFGYGAGSSLLSGDGHDHDVETVAVRISGTLDVDRFQEWIADFIATHARALLRAKGAVALTGVPQRLLFQGVRGRFEAECGRPWGRERRVSRFVFIGHDLDRAVIEGGLAACRTRRHTRAGGVRA